MAGTESFASKRTTTQSDAAGYTHIKDVYIAMRDGIQLCADVFLPSLTIENERKVPVICSLGPYGKDVYAPEYGLPQTSIYAEMYEKVKPLGPNACFELCDPILWTKEYGYAVLRVDARGIGGSQGKLDPFGLERTLEIGADAEGQDLYDVVEWAGTQTWSNGRVAFSGISYYGMVGYWAAMQRPPHLTCVISYESNSSKYQAVRRGGIYSNNFQSHWYQNCVLPHQRGRQDGSLSEAELESNRVDFPKNMAAVEYPTEGIWAVLGKVRKLSDITVPFYLAGNWTDAELHLPGNIRAFNAISSEHKWLEMHTGDHVAAYYAPEHIALQKKFLDFFLHEIDSGMLQVPRIRLAQHHGTEVIYREDEIAFPPPDAEYVPLYLTTNGQLSSIRPKEEKVPFEYQGMKDNLLFKPESAFTESVEILGSPYLRLEIATEAEDMDLFIYLRALDSNDKVISLLGNHGEPMDSFARGYFRLSHRREVEEGFEAERVIAQPAFPKSEVTQGHFYTVTVPLYPTAFLFDQGQKLSLEIGSVNSATVIPPMRHEGGDRTKDRFIGKNTILSHGQLLLPIVRR